MNLINFVGCKNVDLYESQQNLEMVVNDVAFWRICVKDYTSSSIFEAGHSLSLGLLQ